MNDDLIEKSKELNWEGIDFPVSNRTGQIKRLEEDIKEIYEMIKFPKILIMTHEDRDAFNAATVCHICGEDLLSDKVRDHCHITGRYRGAAHNSCN